MADVVDKKAFHQFSYGLFLLASRYEGRDNGCIVNTAIQSASEPRQVTVAVIKGSCTQEMIAASGVFSVSILAESTPNEYFKHFGMQSGHDVEKFTESESAGIPGARMPRTANGLAYEASANAYFSCKVVSQEDLGSHVLYTGEVTEASRLSDEPSITYDYYRNVTRKQAAPVQATTGDITAWKCAICGYIYEGAELPADFICPLCKHGAEDFEPVYAAATEAAAATMATMASAISNENSASADESASASTQGGNTMKWVCKVCGYIYEGEAAPEQCPVCKAPASMFEKVEGELKLAAEHQFGVYVDTVKNNPDLSDQDKEYIREQLFANFNGECSEVGMYLCMARVAHREGYPEVGLYWEKAAWEEAEHAAKFAELLGSELEPMMTASTKENLAWRVDCEFGATLGKVELATCAKKNGLDAIHDTVHEMARDEARHGKALKGLLDRYFA